MWQDIAFAQVAHSDTIDCRLRSSAARPTAARYRRPRRAWSDHWEPGQVSPGLGSLTSFSPRVASYTPRVTVHDTMSRGLCVEYCCWSRLVVPHDVGRHGVAGNAGSDVSPYARSRPVCPAQCPVTPDPRRTFAPW